MKENCKACCQQPKIWLEPAWSKPYKAFEKRAVSYMITAIFTVEAFFVKLTRFSLFVYNTPQRSSDSINNGQQYLSLKR